MLLRQTLRDQLCSVQRMLPEKRDRQLREQLQQQKQQQQRQQRHDQLLP
jgi:hypothetical protein